LIFLDHGGNDPEAVEWAEKAYEHRQTCQPKHGTIAEDLSNDIDALQRAEKDEFKKRRSTVGCVITDMKSFCSHVSRDFEAHWRASPWRGYVE